MKSFLGLRLRRLSEERGMTRLAVSKILSVPPSYYNQRENHQRPLTTPLMTTMSSAFGLDVEFFAQDDEDRMFADIREALNTSAPEIVVSATELREFARNHPVPLYVDATRGVLRRLLVVSSNYPTRVIG